MNAGGRFGQIGTCVSRILVMHPDGRIQWIDKARADFGYRSSNLGDYLVLAAEFAMPDEDPKVLLDRYRQVWIYKRQHQPLAQRSAGCVFRNPEGHSAGQLVDQAGCKGLRHGGAVRLDPPRQLHRRRGRLHRRRRADPDPDRPRPRLRPLRLWLQTEIEIWPHQASPETEQKRSCVPELRSLRLCSRAVRGVVAVVAVVAMLLRY